MGEKRNSRFMWGNWKGIGHLENLGIDGKIILKRTLK
jgi:hypothetical protein